MKKLLFILIALGITITSCDKKENSNPLLAEYDTPFNVPPFEDIKLEHFTPAFEEAMKQHKAEIEIILTNPEEATFENTVEASFYAGELLGRVNTVFGTLNSVNISPEIQTLAQEIYPKQSNHFDEITLDPRFFERVKVVYENQEKFNLNDEQAFLLENQYKRFIRSGADLAADKKEVLMKIWQEPGRQPHRPCYGG